MTTGRTPLDEHRELNTDGTAAAGLCERAAEAGVEYVHFQTVTLTGRLVGKTVPARQLRRGLETGVQMFRSVLADLRTDAAGAPLGGGEDAAEFTAMPDLDTFAVLPWDPRSAWFLCRLYEPGHRPDGVGGRPLATDARGALRRLHADFTARTGLELRSGCEPEATWSGPGLERPEGHRVSPAFDCAAMDRLRPVYQRVVEYGQALGLEMIEGGHEGDDGQLEMNWLYDHADRTADRLVVHRTICRQVARESGAAVTFMPKAAANSLGNGLHHNLSLWRGGENAFSEPGETALHLTETGRHAVGGVLRHTAAMAAVVCPTVNSYKRLDQAGGFTPSRVDWGWETKTCAVRVPANGRIEYRVPDAMANPYLSHAVLLAAVEDGIKNQIDPGPAKGCGPPAAAEPFPGLPASLGEALELFTASPVITGALGRETAELFTELKSAEWARFRRAVTDWELAEYRDAGC
ncbi:glutamine synthetase family protein [Allonocardiopsis opalescens]|uniref:Glutamine synthetase n=1 Tax=Allonocardiopsis opalescens TaxID=1144618 RepID=A0A2T0PYV2_9ACTN|nr:glutamine synthetase family protein [Allonocardiopsis opalescens]PRX96639.1 glutamine synthetase [Allonocardiopsis opalescens]